MNGQKSLREIEQVNADSGAQALSALKKLFSSVKFKQNYFY